ncbi:MAG: S8 family serine peptidase [Thermoplasmata archaeon]|nr:S8 family serine peptidase [Thermoplasmata archaeon]
MRGSAPYSIVLATAFLLVCISPQAASSPVDEDIAGHAPVFIEPGTTSLTVETSTSDAFWSVISLAECQGADITFMSEATGIMSIEAGAEAAAMAEEIASLSGVVSVSSASEARISFTPDDDSIDDQWALSHIDAYEAWDITLGTDDVIVAVLDTGIDWNHPDLSDNMWSNDDGYHGYNFISDNWYPMDDNVDGYDSNGDFVEDVYTYHGTHVAGVVGAATDNSEGMAGLAQVRLMAVKVMNESGEGTDATVSAGLRWAADNGADIVVMSLGVEGISITLQNAVNYAAGNGVVMVAASGNSGESTLSYPAAFPPVISVGAATSLDRRADFSNYGTGLDLMAPGVNIYSTQGGGGYQLLSGTSTAAPHVAGVAALMLSMNPALSPEDLGAALNETATDIGTTGYDTVNGWGLVNAFGAVEAVSDPTVTITDFPETVDPNSTFSVTWVVSGGEPGDIGGTYLAWGASPSDLDGMSATYTGTTWATFTVDGVESLPSNGTMYLRAYAEVDGLDYASEVIEVSVTEAAADNILMQFIEQVRDFIVDDLGIELFIVILAVFLVIVMVIAATVSSRRRAAAAAARQRQLHMQSLSNLQGVQGAHHVPPPPPPPPRFEAYIDITNMGPVPPTLRIVEGTKVVWVNRTWAPPPGVAVRSGTFGDGQERHDGVFQSGMLIAPGDYWSVTFHKPGEYQYYVTTVWKSGRVIVEVYKPEQVSQPLQQPVP